MNHWPIRWQYLAIQTALSLGVCLVGGQFTTGLAQQVGYGPDQMQTPVNQVVTPFGQLEQLPGLRPQTIALAPDGELLVVAGKTSELLVFSFDSEGTAILMQRVPYPDDRQTVPADPEEPVAADARAQASYTGLVFSPAGDRIYASNVNGSIKVFRVDEAHQVQGWLTIPLPPANAPRRAAEIPSGLCLDETGEHLYVCGNLSNQLLEIDLATRTVLRTLDVGVAPYDVKVVGDRAFVSNWGGRRPQAGDLTGPAGRGTVVRVDPQRFIASEGSVSILDLPSGDLIAERLTGLHASALAVSPDKQFVVCANAASDTLSVIDANSGEIVETIWAKPSPADLFGAAPNALAFGNDDELWVANGSYNAVGLVQFEPRQTAESKLKGLVPTGWYPGGLVYDPIRQQICVTNIKGLPDQPKSHRSGGEGFNTHHYQGSLSVFPAERARSQLAELSQQVSDNLLRPRIEAAALPPRSDAPPRPIPERIGEPSLIKHVVYVIKENRTYDQVLGEIEEGRGNPELCIFGEEITPNQHKMVREFVLLDNTYCAGILSADGHQWSTTAMSTDYMEKSFAGFPRSYPDGMTDDDVDALAYSPAGFIWDNAVRFDVTIRNYGEFMMPRVRWRDADRSGTPPFMACYRTWNGESDEVIFASEPGIESVRSFSPTNYVGWEMAVPDQYRADLIIRELAEFESKGQFPQLTIICLPNDHTSGTTPGFPTPAASMADNDLAFGRIVDALSHSRFWPEMAIFAIEDDPQAGWDHVSGYRTTAYCISPYAKRGAVVSTYYNTTCVLRTIEQILGLPPMNIFDASAMPMFDCFQETANLKPFNHVPNNVPLDQLNPEPHGIRDPQLRADALASAQMNFREIDRAPEDQLNRILWRAMRGTAVDYPQWAVTTVDDDDGDE